MDVICASSGDFCADGGLLADYYEPNDPIRRTFRSRDF